MKKALKIFLIIFIVGAVLNSISSNSSKTTTQNLNTQNNQQKTQTDQASKDKQDEQEKIYSINDEIDLDKYILKLEDIDISYGSQFLKPKSGKKWVNLKFTVKNKTDKSIYVDIATNTYLMDSEGHQYNWTSTDKTMQDDELLISEFMPKAIKTGWIGFSVPKEVNELTIYHQYDTFNNKIVKIKINLDQKNKQ